MSLKIAYKTDNPAYAISTFSLLQSGGFHPEIFNFHHGFIAIGYLGALGGFQIMLPEDEICPAQKFVASVEPITDYDPIKPKTLRNVVHGSILTQNPFFCLLMLSPIILTAFWILLIGLDYWREPRAIIYIIFEYSAIACIIGILAHAKYIAVPKLRKTDAL